MSVRVKMTALVVERPRQVQNTVQDGAASFRQLQAWYDQLGQLFDNSAYLQIDTVASGVAKLTVMADVERESEFGSIYSVSGPGMPTHIRHASPHCHDACHVL